jgi:ADP-ribose pyrophosphatase
MANTTWRMLPICESAINGSRKGRSAGKLPPDRGTHYHRVSNLNIKAKTYFVGFKSNINYFVMDDLSWKTLSTEYLFKDTWFTIRKDTCQTKDGKIISPYYVYEFPTWVTAVALTKEGKVIMERQYRHAIGETHLEIPGGCVDPTDTSLQAAIARELKEETGYQFSNFEYLGKISANPSTNNNWMHMFLAMGGVLTQEQELDHNEEIEVLLLTIDEVKELLKEHKIIQSMHVTALFYALEKLALLKY